MKSLYALHVMPLLPGYEKELAEDAETLLNSGVCTGIACMMTLVPEGDPAVNKAEILRKRYQAFLRAFRGDPDSVGILLQATIGHGWTPDTPAVFQKIVRPDGSNAYQMCPLGEEFRAYIDLQVSILSELKPAFFMVDDDFRIVTGRSGCWCPLHIAEFSRRTGKTYTRESLLEAVKNDPETAKNFDAMQLDSLLGVARIIREAIDRHATGTPCSFCTCTGDVHHATAIRKALAGNTPEKIVRINNARYLNSQMRDFAVRMYQGAAQIAALEEDTVVLAETDTCPQTRYSTAAALMHAHYAGSILEGCAGAKHWITPLHEWEPEAGAEYRRILTRFSGFYTELFRALDGAEATPFAAASFPEKPFFRSPLENYGCTVGAERTWGHLLSVLGLPCSFVKNPDIPVMLAGPEVKMFSDAELEKFASHGMLLDGPAAYELTKRGLSRLIGVEAVPWDGFSVSGEDWNGVSIHRSPENYRLKPLSDKVEVHASLIHRLSGVSEETETLSPSLTAFENERGGRSVVFAGTPGGSGFEPFGFLNLRRKRQLVRMLEYICRKPIPFYYPGDAEIYFKLFRRKDGGHLLAFFNLSFDPMENIPLVSSVPVGSIERLTSDGKWVKAEFCDGAIQVPLRPAFPEVFLVK